MLRFAHPLDVPAHIDLLFQDGVPVAVNGIAMGLPELTESLSTIAADHGIGASASDRAISSTLIERVLDSARQAVAAGGTHMTGVVRLKLHQGEHTILSVSHGIAQLS